MFTILATRSEMGRLASEIADALRQYDDGSLPMLNRELDTGIKASVASGIPLWSSYATLFREQSADVSLGFELVPSLDEAHEIAVAQPSRLTLLSKLLIVLLAAIGAMTVFGWLSNAVTDLLS